MVIFQKPESALRRATELLEVGRKQDALDTLHEVIKNRRARVWSKVHEQIMFNHLELCVELRKPHLAKDGLFQYRNMCQQVNAKSLEDVIHFFLDLAEKKAEQARVESQGLVEDVEDLDQAESPEKLLLSAVSGEGAQERSDRTILSPWLRFLWESYRQCLELLRNNMQVETLYHKVAKQAFSFCLKFQRKAEFRKLCDNLRTHLIQIQKAQHHAHYALKLTNAETLAMHQETRLIQLDIAIQMELWQEAFKSIEDVHQLMQLSKKQARASAMASYYEKLALVFWKADSSLYHAAVLLRLFPLIKEQKRTASVEEIQHLATRVLLAILSITSTGGSELSRHLEMEEVFVENQRRLTTYISSTPNTPPPTRQSLLKDIVRLNIAHFALPVAQNLYRLFEIDFCPLTLAKEAETLFESISELNKPEYSKYLTSLKEVVAFKILKQVSQVYSSVTFSFLDKIIPFFNRIVLEKLVVLCGKKALIRMRIHHRNESVEFGLNTDQDGVSSTSDLSVQGFGTQSVFSSAVSGQMSGNTRAGEPMRQHLQQMYKALNDAWLTIDDQRAVKLAESLRHQISVYAYHKEDQHAALLNRKRRIEQYKEETERLKNDEEARQREQQRKENEEKQRQIDSRLRQEMLERQEMQKLREQEDLQRRMMQDRLDRMKDPKLRKLIENLPEDELKNLDHDLICQKQIDHLEKEKREHLVKLKQQEKKWDYLVRALHIEEVEMRQAEYEKWAVEDRESWEKFEQDRIEKAHREHELLVKTVERMKRIDDADEIIGQIRQDRKADFTKRLSDWERRLKEVREQRLQERKDERKAKRREEWLAQKKEAERKKKEEEERLKREQEIASRKQQFGGSGRRPGGDQNTTNLEPAPGDGQKWERAQMPPGGAARQVRDQIAANPDLAPSDGQKWTRAQMTPAGGTARQPRSGDQNAQNLEPAPTDGQKWTRSQMTPGGAGRQPRLGDQNAENVEPAPVDGQKWGRGQIQPAGATRLGDQVAPNVEPAPGGFQKWGRSQEPPGGADRQDRFGSRNAPPNVEPGPGEGQKWGRTQIPPGDAARQTRRPMGEGTENAPPTMPPSSWRSGGGPGGAGGFEPRGGGPQQADSGQKWRRTPIPTGPPPVGQNRRQDERNQAPTNTSWRSQQPKPAGGGEEKS